MELMEAKENRIYIPLSQRDEPEEKQMRVILGSLNAAEEAYLRDAAQVDEDGNTAIKNGTEYFRALSVGVVRFENLTKGGEPFEIKRDPTKGRLPGGKSPWSDDLMLIPRQMRDEIALEVVKYVFLSEETLKNL